MNTTPPKISNERSKNANDITQPWKHSNGKINVNEKFIKKYGAKKHPDKEVRDFYTKKGY